VPAPTLHPWAWPNAASVPWPPFTTWPGVSFRGPIIQAAGFTSDPPDKFGNPPPDLTITDGTFKMTAKNHLLLLGEFYATFLLSWSPVLWCFPQGGTVPFTPPSPWDEEAEAVAQFGAGLKAVRRALANIATYMICDDHEVTDDWYLNRLWCNRVLGQDADTL